MDDQATVISEIQNQASALQDTYSDNRDIANQFLGEARLAGASEEFFRTVRISKLAFIKENKLYKDIAGQKSPHGAEKLRGTWEEYCNLLGRSVDQIDRDIANLKAFGEEALESMSRMGIGYREMRQYRKLPEDQKQALIEVAASGDKENFVELAEEIIAKHAKEKETLTKERDEALADAEATREVSAGKDQKINQLATDLEKNRRRISTQEPDEVAKELQIEAAGIAAEFKSLINAKLRPAAEALMDYQALHPDVDQQAWLASTIADLQLDLTNLCDDFQLDTLQPGQMPDWMDPEKVAQVHAQVEKARDEKGY